MKPPTKLPHDQSALWLPVARHGSNLDARAMPDWFKGWDDADLLRRVLSHPGKYVFISEPFGADRSAPHYLFNEWDTCVRTIPVYDNGFLEFLEFLDKIESNGRQPVIYIGTPRTQHDEHAVAEDMFDWFDETGVYVQFALDAASGMGTDSPTWRVVQKYGGPERFWIEAHPSLVMKHWDGYRVVSLARERKLVDAFGGLTWHPTPDHWHPEIAVMMTGHGRLNPAKIDTAEIRKAKEWAAQGKIIGWQLHEPEWGEVFEVVK